MNAQAMTQSETKKSFNWGFYFIWVAANVLCWVAAWVLVFPVLKIKSRSFSAFLIMVFLMIFIGLIHWLILRPKIKSITGGVVPVVLTEHAARIINTYMLTLLLSLFPMIIFLFRWTDIWGYNMYIYIIGNIIYLSSLLFYQSGYKLFRITKNSLQKYPLYRDPIFYTYFLIILGIVGFISIMFLFLVIDAKKLVIGLQWFRNWTFYQSGWYTLLSGTLISILSGLPIAWLIRELPTVHVKIDDISGETMHRYAKIRTNHVATWFLLTAMVWIPGHSSSPIKSALEPCGWLDSVIHFSTCWEQFETSHISDQVTSNNGEFLAVRHLNRIEVYRLENYALVAELDVQRDFDDYPFGMTFTGDDRFLLVHTPEGQILLWDYIADDVQLFGPSQTEDGVYQIAISSDVMYLAGIQGDQVVVWQLSTEEMIHQTEIGDVGISSIDFSQDNRYLLFGTNEGNVYELEIASDKQPELISGQLPGLEKVSYLNNDRHLAAGYTTEGLWLWDEGEIKTLAARSKGRRFSMAFTPNGKLLVAEISGRFLVWRTSDGALVQTLDPCQVLCIEPEYISNLKVTNKYLSAEVSFDGIIQVWPLPAGGSE